MPDAPFSEDAALDPDTFAEQVADAIDDINTEIEAGFDAANNWIAENATLAGTVVGGVLLGPAGALLGGAVGDNVEDDVREAIEEIRDKWREVQEVVQDKVLSNLGDPVRLGTMAGDYREAAALLSQIGNEVVVGNGQVAGTWSGNGYNAYRDLSELQVAAAADLEANLRDAAGALDRGSDTIVSMWTEQLRNLVRLYGDVVSAVAEIADAGNWATLGAGPLVNALTAAINGVMAVFTTYVEGASKISTIVGGLLDGVQSDVPEWPDVDDRANGPWVPAAA